MYCLFLAVIAFDDIRMHRVLFSNDYEIERFYRYLWFASQNSFLHLADVYVDKIIELLDKLKQAEASESFNGRRRESDDMSFGTGIFELQFVY